MFYNSACQASRPEVSFLLFFFSLSPVMTAALKNIGIAFESADICKPSGGIVETNCLGLASIKGKAEEDGSVVNSKESQAQR